MKNKTIYYTDELNDEFSTAKIDAIKIDKDYVYLKKTLWYKIKCFILYRLIALPLAFVYCKFKHHYKIVNKKKFKEIKNGAFLFGNHTQAGADALMPTLMSFPHKIYLIVHPNNVSIKGMKRITPKLGALPLPDTIDASRNFINTLKYVSEKKAIITIYPEAHIWPYCTWIRNFSAKSFHYPVTLDKPVYCFTNTYQKRKFSKKPKIVTYVDGPFFTNKELSVKEQMLDLRNQVYEKMVERSKMSNVEMVTYIKKENSND